MDDLVDGLEEPADIAVEDGGKAVDDHVVTPPDGEQAGPADESRTVAKLRREAANYRTRLREAEEAAAANAGLADRMAAMEQELAEARRAVIVAKHNIPEDLAQLLVGSADEMERVAGLFAKNMLTRSVPTPSGGLDPSVDVDLFDPVAAANAAYSRIY